MLPPPQQQLAGQETLGAREIKGKSVLAGNLDISSGFWYPILLAMYCFSHNLIGEIVGCYCSPGEEMALVDHLKGMSLTAGAKHELKSLLVSLVMLGEEETARKLQNTGENFQLSQMAAFKLAEDTMSTDVINEHAHKLECYVQTLKIELKNSEAFSWRSQVFLSP